jgi:hypothetical protein
MLNKLLFAFQKNHFSKRILTAMNLDICKISSDFVFKICVN